MAIHPEIDTAAESCGADSDVRGRMNQGSPHSVAGYGTVIEVSLGYNL
ncbi:MAG: hypothetical protein ABSB60_18920 [Terracidiphilus sp.]